MSKLMDEVNRLIQEGKATAEVGNLCRVYIEEDGEKVSIPGRFVTDGMGLCCFPPPAPNQFKLGFGEAGPKEGGEENYPLPNNMAVLAAKLAYDRAIQKCQAQSTVH